MHGVAMRFLLVLLTLVLTVSVRADVIVYKGVARCALPSTTSQFSARPRVYYVVDLTANKGYFVHYYTINRQKGSQTTLAQDNTRYVAQVISATKTAGTFSHVADNSLGIDVGVNMIYLRGFQAAVQLSTDGGGTVGNFPKTLAGFYRVVQKIGSTVSLFEFNYALTFDAAHTQLANNAFKDGMATVTDILNELSVKGF
jgi:hypothetical protein